jgi:hypothetical protein
MIIGSLLALALAAADAPPVRDPEIPPGAPTDDYGFVAWCHGALSGHMELRELVKDELDALSPGPSDDDARQKEAGDQYLALYTRALRAAEKASPTALEQRGRAAAAGGYGMWSSSRNAEPRNRMWSYLNWELPGRCETVAKTLEERSSLFGEALREGGTVRPVAAAEPEPSVPENQPLRGPQ